MRAVQIVDVRNQIVFHVRKALAGENQVVDEGNDLLRALDGSLGAEGLVHEMGGHAGEVIMAEAPVGGKEEAVARLDLAGRHHLVAGDDLFGQGERPGAASNLGGTRRLLARKMRLAVGQQATGADDILRHLVAAFEKLLKRNRFFGGDAVEDREISGGQNAEIVAVLAVDALEAAGDDQTDAGRFLSQRAVLARGTFAVALAGNNHLEATIFDGIDANRQLALDLVSDVSVMAEARVVDQHDGDGRDLVGGDVIAQRRALPEREVGPIELRANVLDARGKKEQAPGESNFLIFHVISRRVIPGSSYLKGWCEIHASLSRSAARLSRGNTATSG